MNTANTKTLMRCLLASVLVAGCDHTLDTDEEPTPDTPVEVTIHDVEHYRAMAQQVDDAVRAYEAGMADPVTAADCYALHAGYDDGIRPIVEHMLLKADPLDVFIKAQGSPEADLACGAHALMDELDDHGHVACMWPGVDGDRTEATRHINIMLRFTSHALQRCDEMSAGMAGEGWTFHSMECAY